MVRFMVKLRVTAMSKFAWKKNGLRLKHPDYDGLMMMSEVCCCLDDFCDSTDFSVFDGWRYYFEGAYVYTGVSYETLYNYDWEVDISEDGNTIVVRIDLPNAENCDGDVDRALRGEIRIDWCQNTDTRLTFSEVSIRQGTSQIVPNSVNSFVGDDFTITDLRVVSSATDPLQDYQYKYYIYGNKLNILPSCSNNSTDIYRIVYSDQLNLPSWNVITPPHSVTLEGERTGFLKFSFGRYGFAPNVSDTDIDPHYNDYFAQIIFTKEEV